MRYQKERELVVEYGKKLITEHLTAGTGGNISIYDRKENLMIISPSGIPYFDTSAEDVVVMTLDGEIIEGIRKPSSEWGLHAAMYKVKPLANAVVHAHSMYCTVLSCLHQELVGVHYQIAAAGTTRVPLAHYETYGTPELAKSVAQAIGKSNAVLLANHGMLTVGNNVSSAFSLACSMEWLAEVQYKTMCAGKPVVLDDTELNRVIEKFKSYGQK